MLNRSQKYQEFLLKYPLSFTKNIAMTLKSQNNSKKYYHAFFYWAGQIVSHIVNSVVKVKQLFKCFCSSLPCLCISCMVQELHTIRCKRTKVISFRTFCQLKCSDTLVVTFCLSPDLLHRARWLTDSAVSENFLSCGDFGPYIPSQYYNQY